MYIIDRMMSEAMKEWSNGDYKESLVLSLLGIAAVSRLHYPQNKEKSDRKAYEAYLSDKLGEILSRYLGDIPMGQIANCIIGGRSLQSILYETLRCSIVHELRFPDEVGLKSPKDMTAPIEVHQDGSVIFSDRLPLALMFVVANDPKVKELRISGQMESAHSPQYWLDESSC